MTRAVEANEGPVEEPDFDSGPLFQPSTFRGPLAGLRDLAELLKRRSGGSPGDQILDQRDPSIRAVRIGNTNRIGIEFVPTTDINSP